MPEGVTLSKYSNIIVIHAVNKHLLHAYFLYLQMLGKHKQKMAAEVTSLSEHIVNCVYLIPLLQIYKVQFPRRYSFGSACVKASRITKVLYFGDNRENHNATNNLIIIVFQIKSLHCCKFYKKPKW